MYRLPIICMKLKKENYRGAWVPQYVKRLTLDFGLGHDVTVHEMEFQVGLRAASTEPAWDCLVSLSLLRPPPPTPRALPLPPSLFLKINK